MCVHGRLMRVESLRSSSTSRRLRFGASIFCFLPAPDDLRSVLHPEFFLSLNIPEARFAFAAFFRTMVIVNIVVLKIMKTMIMIQ